MSLIELLVGLAIGLLIILAAVASLLIVRGSSRAMTDSAALEQQATLAMLQMGQQITQAGGYNAYLAGANPDDGTDGQPAAASVIGGGGALGMVSFDTRPIGVSAARPTTSVFGVDGGTPPASDKLSVSYAVPNDGSPAAGCAGMTAASAAAARLSGGAVRIVSTFAVDPATHSLTCTTEDDLSKPDPAAGASPIAGNVANMRVGYLSVASDGTVTNYPSAAKVQEIAAADPWTTINGVQICLEMVGDNTQTVQQTYNAQFDNGNFTDCMGQTQSPKDGRLHRIVRNTFYLRNF